jgi:2-iminobutanoate/2-iminopropanoate deaminase
MPPPRDASGAIARRGDLFVAAGVAGVDRRSGERPRETQSEFDLAFENLAALLGDAGAALEEVGLVNVWIPNRDARAFIDPAWLRVFPGPVRPARKTNEAPLPDGASVLLQAFGRSGSTAVEVAVSGLVHRSPLPAAARLGSWVFSSVICGDDLKSGAFAEMPEAQIAQAFDNVGAVMEAAGGALDGVNHLWVFLSDMALNRTMLSAYLRAFPRERDRPARKTVAYKLPPGLHIQVQFVGDVVDGRRNFEAPGVWHHDPIPLASLAGGLLLSSGVHGIDPHTSQMVKGGVREETRVAVGNVEALMEAADGSLSDVAGLTVLVRDYADAPAIRDAVGARFGDLPALHFANYPLPDELNVQFHIAAARGLTQAGAPTSVS